VMFPRSKQVGLNLTISSTVDWIERQVAPALAVTKDFYGFRFQDLLNDILRDGKSRWRAPHLAMLKGKDNSYQGYG